MASTNDLAIASSAFRTSSNYPTPYSFSPYPNQKVYKEFPASRLSIAPMLDVTDRHFRYLFRRISKRCRLWTEMIVDQTLLYNVTPPTALEFFLGAHESEGPCTVQLGGNDPELLGKAAAICEQYGGYDEINLNCGCPSPKVSARCFGARLMLDPERVRQIVSTMKRSVNHTEITVKCRLGADDCDSYEELCNFVLACKSGGVKHMIIHARKCILDGMSAAKNRSIPPLHYDVVHRLCTDFPDMIFSLNGGINSLDSALEHLSQPDDGNGDYDPYYCSYGGPAVYGVMMGRAACHNTWGLREMDQKIFCDSSYPMRGVTRDTLLDDYLNYAEDIQERYGDFKSNQENAFGWASTILLRPVIGLFHGERGSARFKDTLNLELRKGVTMREALDSARAELPLDVLHSRG